MVSGAPLVSRQPGIPLSRSGGLPRPNGPVDFATGFRKTLYAASKIPKAPADMTADDQQTQLARIANLSPSLASVLRPQAAYRWLLPYLASITPTYIESVLRGALAGNHVQSWELFDLMIDSDPEIASCVQEYVEGVLNHKIVFEPYHEEDEEPSRKAIEKCKLVSSALRGMRPDPANDENALRDTLRDLLFARFFGQSVVEIDWHDTYGSGGLNIKKNIPGIQGQALFPRSTFWVHPVCYAWSMQGRLGLRAAIGDLNRRDMAKSFGPGAELARSAIAGQDRLSMVEPPAWNFITSQPRPDDLLDFPKNKFLISTFKARAGTALAASCLRPLAWWWCASNFCGDWLLNYAQLFGIPFRKATFKPGTSETDQANIRQMLQSCGSAGYILLPDTAELEFMEGGTSAGQSPQAFLFHFADSQKRKVILHQTMTGGQHDSMGKGGGKAFGEVEQDTKGSCIAAGASFVEEQVNIQFIPMLLELNYGKDGDVEAPSCKLVDSAVGGLVDAQTLQAVSTLIDVPASHIRRVFGVPKVATDDEIAGVDQGTTAAQMQQQSDQADANIKAQADQADANRKHAVALAKTAPAGASGATAPGKQGGKDDEADDTAAVDASQAKVGPALGALELKAEGGVAVIGKGCLMAAVNGSDISDFVSWAKNHIPADCLTGDGIEVEPHVTVLYGFNLGFDTERLAKLLSRRTPISFTLGKVSRFEAMDYDVLKFDVISSELQALHDTIATRLADAITPSQHEYNPHFTIAYVKRGSCKELDGNADFEGDQFRISELVFSEPEHTNREMIYLRARRMVTEARPTLAVDAKEVAAALHGTVEPLLARIEAISKVPDKPTRTKLTQKLLKDMPHLAVALTHDDSVARAIAPKVIKRFIEGLKEKG